VEQGEKLSRVPLHSVKDPNSYIKPLDSSMSLNFDVNRVLSTDGRSFYVNIGRAA
jgi:hypothetical protein